MTATADRFNNPVDEILKDGRPYMRRLPRNLKRLAILLQDLSGEQESMQIDQLDGFIAGVLVCPQLIMPGEWLPVAWSGDDGGVDSPKFENVDQAQEFSNLIMEHYNSVANDLQRGCGHCKPVLSVHKELNEVFWELWIAGFDMAISLRPGSWSPIFESDDEDSVIALAGLTELAAISSNESELSKETQDDLTRDAPDLIPYWVECLNLWRLRHAGRSGPTAEPLFGKVGRNEPCPCGSGKKYKKCCGLN